MRVCFACLFDKELISFEILVGIIVFVVVVFLFYCCQNTLCINCIGFDFIRVTALLDDVSNNKHNDNDSVV